MSQEVKGLRPGMWCKPKDKQEWQLLRHLANMIWPYATTYQDKEDEWHFRHYAKHSIVAVINDEPIAATPDWAHEGRPMVSVPEFIARCYEQAEINKNKEGQSQCNLLRGGDAKVLPGIWPEKGSIFDHEKRIKALEEGAETLNRRADHVGARLNQMKLVSVEDFNDLKERVSKLEAPSDFVQAPPIGLVPRWIRNEQRLKEIRAAMDRYTKAGVDIPVEWGAEHAMLCMEEAQRMGTRPSPLGKRDEAGA